RRTIELRERAVDERVASGQDFAEIAIGLEDIVHEVNRFLRPPELAPRRGVLRRRADGALEADRGVRWEREGARVGAEAVARHAILKTDATAAIDAHRRRERASARERLALVLLRVRLVVRQRTKPSGRGRRTFRCRRATARIDVTDVGDL